MIIDSHHHLWRYDPSEYAWIGDGMGAIARDFTAADLRSVAGPLGVAGSIAVQARQTVEETDALLAVAEQDEFVLGVVGWAPLASDRLPETLDRWSDQAALKGLRHVVQDEPDDNFFDGTDFNRGVAEALARGFRYDLLIFARQLPATIRFVDRHPGGRFVLDHIGKPVIKAGEIDSWRTRVTELAERPHVACKVSGVVTEADWAAWTPESIRPYLDAALEAFGPERLMFGSDWPVSLLATEYERWVRVVTDWVAELTTDEQEAVLCRTACDFYGVEITS